MMTEEEKECMLRCMVENIRCKTLYLLCQNRLHAAIYADHILDDHKEHIFEDIKDHSSSDKLKRNFQSLMNLLLETAFRAKQTGLTRKRD